jgi:hypothetical protein
MDEMWESARADSTRTCPPAVKVVQPVLVLSDLYKIYLLQRLQKLPLPMLYLLHCPDIVRTTHTPPWSRKTLTHEGHGVQSTLTSARLNDA